MPGAWPTALPGPTASAVADAELRALHLALAASRPDADLAGTAAAAAAGASARGARAGRAARRARTAPYRSSIFVPEEETCFLFEADSVDAVREVARLAHLPCDRVSAAFSHGR
jgi:hypothetical protein